MSIPLGILPKQVKIDALRYIKELCMRFFIIFLTGFLASIGLIGFFLYIKSLKKRLKEMEEKILTLTEKEKTLADENQNLNERLDKIEEIVATGDYKLEEKFKNLDR